MNPKLCTNLPKIPKFLTPLLSSTSSNSEQPSSRSESSIEREKTLRKRLVEVSREMYHLTNKRCGDYCGPDNPFFNDEKVICCEDSYCEATAKYAKEIWNVLLQPTGHPTVRFLGPTGCSVEPHLRPLCTEHQCNFRTFGKFPDSSTDTSKFVELLKEMEDINYQLSRMVRG